jgi:hypothetical protein
MVKSCKLTAELIDKQAIMPLTTKDKLQLKLHKAMCKTCTAYEHQSKLIDRMISNLFTQDNSSEKLKFSEENKANIIKEINKL